MALYPERADVTDPAITAGRLRGISMSVRDQFAFLLKAAKTIEDRFCGGRVQEPILDWNANAPLQRM